MLAGYGATPTPRVKSRRSGFDFPGALATIRPLPATGAAGYTPFRPRQHGGAPAIRLALALADRGAIIHRRALLPSRANAMSSQPLRLTAGDLDAYSPSKATSKAYSRPRMETKARALAWARAVVARLAEHGISVDVHGSDEHPTLRNKHWVDCQWVFFWRDEKAREELDRLLDRGRTISEELDDPSPYRRHAFLGLRIAENGVEVCFAVHPDAKVDVENLRARLEADGSPFPAELTDALHALPEQFSFGAGDERVACSGATTEAILAMLRRAADGQVPLWIGWSVDRETALEHADILDEQLEDALMALAPIYRLVAWSRDSDRLGLDRRLEGIEQERARNHAELEAQNERWKAEQAAARERSMEQARARVDARVEAALPARRPTLENLFKSLDPRPARAPERPAERAAGPRPQPQPRRSPDTASGSRAGAASGSASAPVTASASAPVTASAPATASASGSASAPGDGAGKHQQAQPGPLDKGAKVRVLNGPFEGKLGVIGELDGRGGARVHLGLLSTRLELTDLEPASEGQGRPSLSSSHRKPHASAPRKAR